VRRHGGDIRCRSTLGVGTTFSFTIAHECAQGATHA
jgi:signal transduction histidine kinase